MFALSSGAETFSRGVFSVRERFKHFGALFLETARVCCSAFASEYTLRDMLEKMLRVQGIRSDMAV